MEFVAFLGVDKENWGQLTAVMNHLEDCEKVIVVKNKSADDFSLPQGAELIEINSDQPLVSLKNDLLAKLKPLLSGDFEVALSIASGTGKEHMALIGALLSIPVGIKLVAYTKEGIVSLT